jgi:hypothetical protein
MQRDYKHAFPTIERLCSLRGPCKVVIKKSEVDSSQVESGFETPACQDMSLGSYELNWVESSELAAAE